MTLSISGKTAIVTGAADGIGHAIARHFVDRGARVMFADNDEVKLADTIGEEATEDGPIRYFGGDLCQKLTLANLLSATVDAFERVDVLVNAQRSVMTTDPINPDDTSIEAMLRETLFPAVKLSRMTAKRMITQAEREMQSEGPIGTIINISSLAGSRAQPELMAYSIAAAALDQATRSMAVAFAPERIRVNGIAIASVMSASLQAALREEPEWHSLILEGTPLGRIATPSEVAEAAQFLACDGSGFITGHIMAFDGGRGLIDPVRVPAY